MGSRVKAAPVADAQQQQQGSSKRPRRGTQAGAADCAPATAAKNAAASQQPPAKRPRRGDGAASATAPSAAAAAEPAAAAQAVSPMADGGDPTGGSDRENGGSDTDGPIPGETEFERRRRETIARNRERLQQLQLPQLIAGLEAAAKAERNAHRQAKASQRGLGTDGKKARARAAAEPPTLRMSLRQRGIAPDGATAAGVHDENVRGHVVLVAEPRGTAQQQPKERNPKGELPFSSDNADEACDAAFLQRLQAQVHASSAQHDGASSGTSVQAAVARVGASGRALCGLRLTAQDVAKVTKDGVTHLAFFPGSTAPPGSGASTGASGDDLCGYGLLLAAVDKGGRASLWHVDEEEGGPAAGQHGVLSFSPHSEYVSGLAWLGPGAAACRLVTCSYDGSLCALDLGGSGTWLELPAPGADPATREFTSLAVTADGRTAYVGDPEGALHVVDLRASSAEATHAPVLQLSDRKLNTLHLEPSAEQLLCSSSSDGAVAVWDVRALGAGSAAGASSGRGGRPKPLAVGHHDRSCHSAYWAPDGSGRIASTSYDDTVRVWDASAAAAAGHSLQQALLVRHNNQTGRWITPFRSVWSAAADALVVGNMRRGVDVMCAAEGGKLLAMLKSEHMTAIPSRMACHPTLPVMAAATSSGRCHVWR